MSKLTIEGRRKVSEHCYVTITDGQATIELFNIGDGAKGSLTIERSLLMDMGDYYWTLDDLRAALDYVRKFEEALS